MSAKTNAIQKYEAYLATLSDEALDQEIANQEDGLRHPLTRRSGSTKKAVQARLITATQVKQERQA